MRIKINEALFVHNQNAAEKLTMRALAQKVITKPITANAKSSLMSQWNTGNKHCPSESLKRIAEETGVTTDYLVGLADKPTIRQELEYQVKELVKK